MLAAAIWQESISYYMLAKRERACICARCAHAHGAAAAVAAKAPCVTCAAYICYICYMYNKVKPHATTHVKRRHATHVSHTAAKHTPLLLCHAVASQPLILHATCYAIHATHICIYIWKETTHISATYIRQGYAICHVAATHMRAPPCHAGYKAAMPCCHTRLHTARPVAIQHKAYMAATHTHALRNKNTHIAYIQVVLHTCCCCYIYTYIYIYTEHAYSYIYREREA